MSEFEWDGSPLGDDCLALAILTGVSAADDVPRLVAAAAGTGDRRCVIRPGQLGAFLLAHRQCLIACFDAANLHWALEEHLRTVPDRVAWKVLWDFSRDGRLCDVQIFGRLIDLITGQGSPSRSGLDDLAARYGVAAPDSESEMGPRQAEVQGGLPGVADGRRLGDALREVGIVLQVYRKQKALADQTTEFGQIDPAAIKRFGPLSVGVQVRGAIALAQASRSGMVVHPDAIPEVRRLCDDAYREGSRVLWEDKNARNCFRWMKEAVQRGRSEPRIQLDVRGLPNRNPVKLRAWLEHVIDSAPDLYNLPLEPPRTPQGQISTLPDHWGDLVLAHPLLRAWSRLWTAASVTKALEGIGADGRVRPGYEVLPVLRSAGPNLVELRRLTDSPVFRAPPGHVLLVGRFPHLVFHCLAEYCERLDGVTQLGSVLNEGRDPVLHTAWELYRHDTDRPQLDEWTAWDEFVASDAEEPDRFRRWKTLARVLLRAVPRGLGPAHVRGILQEEQTRQMISDRVNRPTRRLAQTPEPSAGEVGRHYRYLIEVVFPELDWFVADETLDILIEKLKLEPLDLRSLMRAWGPETTPAALRNLLAGRTRNPVAFAGLREICRDEHWRERLAAGKGSPELYESLFGDIAVNPVGRMCRGLFFTRARSAAFLDLADDLMKWALSRVVEAGFQLVACAGEEFVILAADSTHPSDAVNKIKETAEGAAREILVHALPRCEVRPQQAW